MKRRKLFAAATVLAAFALVSSGCSSSHDSASSSSKAADHDSNAGGEQAQSDSDAGSGAPDAGIPGGDEDETSASRTPGTDHGTKNRAFSVKGYHASFSALKIPSKPERPQPEKREAPKPPGLPKGTGRTSGVIQGTSPAKAPPPLQVNVAGIHESIAGGLHPPDTSGAIGPDQYVQTVNEALAIYDTSGTQLNFFSFNAFFGQFHTGTPCDNQNGGDPQVIFDQRSNRWILGDLSYPSGGPYYFCMAVSDGPDLSQAGWTAYPFVASPDSLNDYPKIASAPNGIFMTANLFFHFQSFSGVEVWGFKRSSLGSSTLKVQTVKTSSQYSSLLPANSYDTTTSGAPEYLMSLLNTTHIGLWKYDVNWRHPAQTTFTQTPTSLAVNTYQPTGEVPEKSGNSVDSLSDRPMYQLQLAPDGTLWFDHSVMVGSQSGVRWYQVANITKATPTVKQQSTFAPSDGLWRWMGSLAVDKAGDMAVGYSTSSSTAYPSINYATRAASDRKNRLTAEGNIVTGTGSQTVTSRWGDYSQMSLSPVDGCTFWYTTEYYVATGGDWQTRIASFKFPGCS